MPDSKPFAHLARRTALELARITDEREQWDTDDALSHLELVRAGLCAFICVIDAMILRQPKSRAARPPVRKGETTTLHESGEHPVAADMDPTPSGRCWTARVA